MTRSAGLAVVLSHPPNNPQARTRSVVVENIPMRPPIPAMKLVGNS
jgi:hypothetical protein